MEYSFTWKSYDIRQNFVLRDSSCTTHPLFWPDQTIWFKELGVYSVKYEQRVHDYHFTSKKTFAPLKLNIVFYQ